MTTPPHAERRSQPLTAHGDQRVDDWYWLRDRDDPEVIKYLEAENAYTKERLADSEPLQAELYEQIRSRIQESDITAPVRRGQWWYYTRTIEGQQYPVHCRRADPDLSLTAREVLREAESGDADEKVLLDENETAAGSDYFALGVFDVSPDQTRLAYAVDLTGAERYTLRFRDLTTGADLTDEIPDVYYSTAWAADGNTFFYVRPDEAVRPWQVWRHALGQPASADELVFQEDDERFFVEVGLTHSREYVVISSDSKVTSEVRVLPANRPEMDPRLIEARHQGVEYGVEHARFPDRGDVFVILTNDDGAFNFAVLTAPVTDPGKANWQVLVAHRPGVRVDGVAPFAHHLVVSERVVSGPNGGLEQLRVMRLSDGDDHVMEQPEPVYSLGGAGNLEWDTTTFRFAYTSLVTPISSIEYGMDSRARSVVKQQTVLGEYEPSAYQTDRLWATAPDGTHVPLSVVHRSDLPLNGSSPCLLYGYGSYEVTIDPTFSSLRLNLLERGFVFAIAHIRGGGELGRKWYEDGKLLHKQNTFSDFVACAEHLIGAGYTSSDRLVIRGGSAGGLLMGAAVNARPELWRGVVAEVPFVDCLTTMQDASLPLTVTEWEEWGNPLSDADVYWYMKSYSPYDNVTAGTYPDMYVTGGLNDPRVGFWEPAKWVAKLRATRTDDHLLVLKTEMDAGHGGPSGRYDVWKDEAQVQAFILRSVGITS